MEKYKILIIEDDPIIQTELQVLLNGNGYEASAVTDFTSVILTPFLVGKLVVLPPFSRGNTAFFKNAEDFLKFLQKFFERTKCARPKSPDGRIGIVSSIQMIRQFIYISVVSPGGGRAFFDKSITVGFCRYAFCFMAATSFSRRFQQ